MPIKTKKQTVKGKAGKPKKPVRVGRQTGENVPDMKIEPRKRRLLTFVRRKSTDKPSRDEAKAERPRVVAAPRLLAQALGTLKNNWKLFSIILAWYALVSLILVGGVTQGGLSAAKSTLNQTHTGTLSKGLSLFSTIISSFGSSSNPAASVYQTALLLVMSVVLIWALRQLHAGRKIRARDAFYNGTQPLIPFLLVLLVIGLDLVPLMIGALLYSALMNGVALGFLQQAIAALVFFGLAVLSFYLVCSTLMALYIVTLPDMTPMKALKTARGLVRHRRWVVLRKVLFLPFAMLVVGALIIIPFALYITPVAPLIFFALTVMALAVLHSYMYSLYRQLL